MAKVTLEFDPAEDLEEMESALNGWKWKMLVWDLDQHLRRELKYNDKITGEVYEAIEKIREQLHELKSASGLTLE
jgi:ribosome-binding ATPase YchF (GTP1/OBG family)